MTLNGATQENLINIMDEYRKSKPASLHTVLEEVCCAIKSGEIVDAYQARYLRDALYSSEEIKESNKEVLEAIEKNFFS